MPTYKITHPETGQVIRMTGDSPPSEKDIESAFSSVGNKPQEAPAQPPQEQGGFAQTAKSLIRPTLEYGGAIAGGVLGGAGGTLVEPIGGTAGGAAVGAGLGFAAGKRAANAILGEDKGLAENVKSLPSDLATGATMEIGGQITTNLAGKALGAAKNFIPAHIIEKRLDNIVKSNVFQAIRPSVSGKSTSGQIGQYLNNAKEAVKAIVENKDAIKLTDADGMPVEGLPKTLHQFSQAIDGAKKKIFSVYDELAQKTGGAQVDTSKAIKELSDIANSKALAISAPAAQKYALAKIEALKANPLTAKEAQDTIAALNSSLNSFYKNPNYSSTSKAAVDAVLANNLRNATDELITNATGQEYQALKRQYGALKGMEKEVAHRAVVDLRKNTKGLLDFSDMVSGGEAVTSLLTANPALMAKSATIKGISSYFKALNNPNRYVAKMFTGAEKVLSSRMGESPISPDTVGTLGKLATGQTINGGEQQ